MIQAIQAFPFLPSLSHCFDLTHLFTYLAHLCAYAASALLKVNAKKTTYAEREREREIEREGTSKNTSSTILKVYSHNS